MLFVAPVGPFVLGNLGKPKFEMNSIHLWGFRGLGGSSSAYCSVVEELEGAVVEKPAVDSGAAAI
jgi:hypothetical protein